MSPFDLAEMSPEERLEEVAAILAIGYLRLTQKRRREAPAKISEDHAENRLANQPGESE